MASTHETPDLPSQVIDEQTLLRLPSYPHWIEATVDFLRKKAILSGACQESRSGKLMIALHEALSNAIVHGNLELASDLKEQGENTFAEALAQRIADPHYSDRVVEVLVDCNQERCRWMVTDQGKGFDVEDVLRKKTSYDPEELLASGRGIIIMRSFLDDVTYELGGRRLILTLKRESGQEKRIFPRVAVNQPLQVTPIRADGTMDWDGTYEAVSKNFSEQGVSLLQDRLIQTDRVLLGITFNDRLVHVPAEVRHCRPLGGNFVELGCHFQHRVGEAPDKILDITREMIQVHRAVNDLLTRHQGPPVQADDRRFHQRVVYSERIDVVVRGAPQPLVGYARDLSRGGIAFITTMPIPLEVVKLFLPQEGSTPLRLRSQVVRCSKVMDNFYDVGARFLELAEHE